MAKKAVVAGHICLDITPVFPARQAGSAAELLAPGKLINMDGVNISTGGAVANTGLAMKKLGADVRLMGKIGTDSFGSLVLDILSRHGCDGKRDMIQSPDSGTSYSVVLAMPGIDRIFLHSPGANHSFCYDDLDFAAIAEADLFHFGYPPLMERMYEKGGEELVRIFKKVKSLGLATSLDLAAVDPASPAGQVDWPTLLEKLLPYVDFFVPSAEEICFMLDRPRYESWLRRTDGDLTLTLGMDRDIKPLADRLLSMGAKVLLIKCGAPGLYYRTAADLRSVGEKARPDEKNWAGREGFEKSYVPACVRSGTGAGDTSIAAFLTAMLEGRSLENCLQLAAATGAACVEAYDALSGLKSFAELEEKISSGWEKQNF